MSKPKIHGFCAAGCEWEVPHKDEFDKYAKMASRFSAPTLNSAKKLTEGTGYYYIIVKDPSDAVWHSFGIIYWEEGVGTNAPPYVVGGTNIAIYTLAISSTGDLSFVQFYSNATSDRTEYANFYTAKIVDTTIPTSAEEESY